MHKASDDMAYIKGVCTNVYAPYYGAPVDMMDLDFCPYILTAAVLEHKLKVHKKLRDDYIKLNMKGVTYVGKEKN